MLGTQYAYNKYFLLISHLSPLDLFQLLLLSNATMPLPPKITDLIPVLNLIPHPEGGFFVETYRSGTQPMSTQGQTGFDTTNNNKNLIVTTDGRDTNRPDKDVRRNALTSIYWAPTGV